MKILTRIASYGKIEGRIQTLNICVSYNYFTPLITCYRALALMLLCIFQRHISNWGVKARQEISSRIRKEENNTTNSDKIFKKKAPSTSYLNDHKFSPPRKIAIMIEPTPFTHISGYGNRFRYLLRNLERAGDDVHIVTTDDTKEAPNKFLKFPITNVRGFKCPMYDEVKLTIDPDGKGWELLGRLRPDLLHVSTPGFVCFPAIIYARVMRIPLVFSYHTDLAKYMKKYLSFPGFAYKLAYSIIRSVLNKADLNLVTSPQMKEEMEANGVQRVNVWRKGIDTEVFSPSHYDHDMRMRLSNGHPEDPLLVYVGRLAAEKRLRDIRDVLERIPGARVAFVGGGPDAKSLKRYYSGFNAVFMGSLSGEKLSQAFASGDIFLMPSDTETLGFVVLESMASGVPVVASNAGGIPDLIEDGVTGFLCEPGCVEEWVGRVKLLLDDEDIRNKMSAHARSETEKHSWEAATAYLRNVQYTKAINNFRFRDMRHLGAWSGQPRSRSFNRLRNVKREMETKRRVKYFRQILSWLENYIIRCVPEARLGYIPDQI